ncbi:MAG: cytochrome b/b6 domain-containing protein [Bryobacteraceae bacterium]|nr:cytochrome b/b6 domain-containing protein [Bryobacteraceae bacterium]MDW8377410.1 cytochrome b/b6 domain-containing protein [Bryobacterales bacterium]
MRVHCLARAVLFVLLPAILLAQAREADCKSCHDAEAKVSASAHASLSCDTCHDQHTTYPHPQGVEKPACATCHSQQAEATSKNVHGLALKAGNTGAPDCATCHGGGHEVAKVSVPQFRQTLADTCGMCHTEAAEKFKASVHGQAVAKGLRGAPTCTDCHGEHTILAKDQIASPVHRRNIRDTCGRCHGDVRLASRFGLPTDRVTSFDASFHGLAAKGGAQSVANCASCHGFHDVLPSSDPKSMIHPSNLPQTCGQCHPGAGTRFSLGTIHFTEGGNEPGPVRWVRLAYWILIPFTVGLMFLHQAGDWIRKLLTLRFRPASPAAAPRPNGELRMYPFERIQHALLAVSFVVLAWTGFALKWPDAWWAKPLVAWESVWPVRGTVHRIAAVVFMICGVMHLASLVLSPRLRRHWMELIPHRRDFREGLAMLAYNLGLRKTKPQVSPHGYVEKVEYWAVVWGAVIMGISGLLLWFNTWSLQQFPKIWLDVATAVHYYEAVLACLAILVWHFYTVIFDPEVYPMDPAWLTGRSVRRRQAGPHSPEASPLSEPAPGLASASPAPTAASPSAD